MSVCRGTAHTRGPLPTQNLLTSHYIRRVVGEPASVDGVSVYPDSILLNDPIGAPRSRAPVTNSPSLAPSFTKAFPASLVGSTARAEPVAAAAVSLSGCNSFRKVCLARPRRRVFQVIPALARPLGLSECRLVTAWNLAHILMCVRDDDGWGLRAKRFICFKHRSLRRWNHPT
ncbi:uncharacterized protein B0T23DRAFT_314535 [Neurospora hispaniola]|uniref:Uncharacterized protein n=1 Tax=Neurospora hispaniola TaxID=588809 RepID=A0AAJ0IB08_9PEZI|nr:hypothetical protein B0T23DRAFT_314535 [Neurospora hispaniola]